MSAAEPVERSRSNSESNIANASSRAAKRMGFVVSRRNQDLSTVSESSYSKSSRMYTTSSAIPSTSAGSVAAAANGAPSQARPLTRAPPPQLPPSLANGIPAHLSSRLASVSSVASHANGATDAATVGSTSGIAAAPPRRRHHARGISHDSIMEYSYPNVADSALCQGSVPLLATSSSSSTSSSTGHQSASTIRDRDRSDSVSTATSAFSGTSNASGTSSKTHKSNGSTGIYSKDSSNVDVESQPRAYFKRLSVMKEEYPQLTVPSPTASSFSAHSNNSPTMFSTQVVESSRSILFSISQLLPALRHFLAFCDDKKLSTTLANVIYGSKAQIDSLVRSLEHHDALLSSASVNAAAAAAAAGASAARGAAPLAAANSIEPVIHATLACLSTFRHVVSLVQGNIRSLASHAEIRHTRAFFLLLFGTLAEVRNAWNTLIPALDECRSLVCSHMTAKGANPKVFGSMSRSPSTQQQSSLHSTPSLSPSVLPPSSLVPSMSSMTIENIPPSMLPLSMNLPTPSFLPQTPHSIGSQKKVPPAIITSIGTPSVQHPPTPGYFSSGSGGPAVMSPTVGSYYVPSTPMESGPVAFHFPSEPSDGDEELFDRIDNAIVTAKSVLALILSGIAAEMSQTDQSDLKMLDLRNMCEMGLDITGQLKGRLATIHGSDGIERQKFGEETNSFVRVSISCQSI